MRARAMFALIFKNTLPNFLSRGSANKRRKQLHGKLSQIE